MERLTYNVPTSNAIPRDGLRLVARSEDLSFRVRRGRYVSRRVRRGLDTETIHDDMAHEEPGEAETCLVTADEKEICYTVCNITKGRPISGIGGLFVGMVSSSLEELNGYCLLQRCRVPSSVSVAMSVFVVAIAALIASAGHIFQVAQGGLTGLATMGNLLLFTVPGVVIRAQLGPELAEHVMEIGFGVLFTITAGLLLFEAGL